jgi:hypothetical protein
MPTCPPPRMTAAASAASRARARREARSPGTVSARGSSCSDGADEERRVRHRRTGSRCEIAVEVGLRCLVPPQHPVQGRGRAAAPPSRHGRPKSRSSAEGECRLGLVPRSSWMPVALLAMPTAARADVVEPGYRPRQCPPGAWGGFPHGRGPCTAHPCSDDRACFGNVCINTALCLEGNEVISECGAGDICARGRCVREQRCAPKKEGVGGPSGRQGCHCSAPASRGGSLGASLLAIAAVLVARRRRS